MTNAQITAPSSPAAAEQLRESADTIQAQIAGRTAEDLVSPTQLGIADIAMPAELMNLVAQAMGRAAAGVATTLVVVGEEIKTQEAAKILGISRPHLTQLIDAGRIPAWKTDGGQRRLRLTDVLEFKARRDDAPRRLAEVLAFDAELDE